MKTPAELYNEISALAFAGAEVPDELLSEYERVETNDARAYALFTLVEQMALPPAERDPTWRWLN
jgi:hypothetical protein